MQNKESDRPRNWFLLAALLVLTIVAMPAGILLNTYWWTPQYLEEQYGLAQEFGEPQVAEHVVEALQNDWLNNPHVKPEAVANELNEGDMLVLRVSRYSLETPSGQLACSHEGDANVVVRVVRIVGGEALLKPVYAPTCSGDLFRQKVKYIPGEFRNFFKHLDELKQQKETEPIRKARERRIQEAIREVLARE